MIVAVYLAAIVAANLLTARYGPAISIVNAFLLIGLDITLRDRLHDSWHGKHLVAKMGALIFAGSAISYVFNRGAGKVAVASAAAFAAAMLCDSIVYALLGKHHRLVRINGSNVVSSAVDSLVFPTIAFGGLSIPITLAQFAAKILGGGAWSIITMRRAAAVATMLIIAVPSYATDFQLHRDLDREIETLTIESFDLGTVSTFFFIDTDIDSEGIQSMYGEAYASYGKTWHIDAGLNGGKHRNFSLGEWILVGAGYGPFSAYVRIDKDGDIDPQLTYIFNKRFGSFEYCGFADYWKQDGKWILLAEPQVWWNINDYFAVGSEIELSDNFAGSDAFKVRPTIAVRFRN